MYEHPWPFLAGSQSVQIPQARLALAPAKVGGRRRFRSRARPRANGLSPGSREFKTLFNEVASKVQEYSTESGDPLDTLKARLPALCALERLANPAPSVAQNKAGLTLGVLIAAVLGPIVFGALIGLGTGMAHWVSHLFG